MIFRVSVHIYVVILFAAHKKTNILLASVDVYLEIVSFSMQSCYDPFFFLFS